MYPFFFHRWWLAFLAFFILLFPMLPQAADVYSTRNADITFVFDITNSMRSEKDSLQTGAINFAQQLEDYGVDYRLGFVAFGDHPACSGGNYTAIENKGFSRNVTDFSDTVMGISLVSGGYESNEAALDGIDSALDNSFRSDTSKIIILVTDAPPHIDGDCIKTSLSDVKNRLVSKSVKLYVVGPDDSTYQDLVSETNGKWWNIDSTRSFNLVLDEIIEEIKEEVVVSESPSERSALMDLYYSTNGSEWENNDGWGSGNYCDWYGVVCNDTQSVKELNLYDNQLTGKIPNSIGNLTSLTKIAFSNNQLTGEIPSSISSLINLKILSLYENQLTGKIPNFIGNLTSLTKIAFSNNQLTGEIPSSINRLSYLKILSLYGNQLTGEIPSSIGNLTSLIALSLGNNQLTGKIPLNIGRLASLNTFDVSYNQLIGEIPSSIWNLTSLIYLDLRNNQLTEYIHNNIVNLTKLTYLSLSNNHLCSENDTVISFLNKVAGDWQATQTNTICSNLVKEAERSALMDLYYSTNGSNWNNNDGWGSEESYCNWYGVSCNQNGKVEKINLNKDFAGNNLTGEIPSSIGNLASLTYLNLNNNELTGEIPSSIGNLTSLTNLNLNSNELTGEIPSSIGNLTSLTRFSLGNNKLTGDIPKFIGNLTSLTYLDLSGTYSSSSISSINKLTGEIPNSIGNLTSLTYLFLDNNNLVGEIPNSIGNLTSLIRLRLNNNNLVGEIPRSIGNLTSLTYLFLDNNNLIGEIPSSIGSLTSLTYLRLYSNELTGEIPSSIGNLTSLTNLVLSENNLTGKIPNSIGNLTSLTYLALSENSLTEEIPSSIGNLTSLVALDLFNNQLTGDIPSSITNLNKLNSLSIFNNHLCTKNETVNNFINQKQRTANWQTTQTHTPCDPNYFANHPNTTQGYDHTGAHSPLKLEAQLEGNNITFTASKADNSPFQQNGTLHLTVGSFEKYAAIRQSKPISSGQHSLQFDTFDNSQWKNYPKMYFLRFESSDTPYHAYAGPIIISKVQHSSNLTGEIKYYPEGNNIIFEYITSATLDTNKISWYLNDEITTPYATNTTKISVPIPNAFSENTRINYIKMRYDQEWFYITPKINKEVYEFSSFRNYTLTVKDSIVPRTIIPSITVEGESSFFEYSKDNQLLPFDPSSATLHTNTLAPYKVDISNMFTDMDLLIYEGYEDNEYQPTDTSLEDEDVYVIMRNQIDTDEIADQLRILITTEQLTQINARSFNTLDAIELDNIKDEVNEGVLNILANMIGNKNLAKFIKHTRSITKATVAGIDLIELSFELINLNEQFNEIEYFSDYDDATKNQYRLLYVTDKLFNETPLSKFLIYHELIGAISVEMQKLNKTLEKRYSAFSVAKQEICIKRKDGGVFFFDKKITTSDIESISILPIRIMHENSMGQIEIKPIPTEESIQQSVIPLYDSEKECWYTKAYQWYPNGELNWDDAPVQAGNWVVQIVDNKGKLYNNHLYLAPSTTARKTTITIE